MTRSLTLSALSIVLFLGCKKQISAPAEELAISPAANSKGGPPATPNIVHWQKCIGTSANEFGYSVTKTANGDGYIICGTTETVNRGPDVLVAKIDLTGTVILWQKTYGGTGTDEGKSIVATPDGGCLIAARSTSNDGDVQGKGDFDIWLIKLSASGDLDVSQSRTLGGSSSEITGKIIATLDGGYAIAGLTASNDGDLAGSGTTKGRGWAIKLDASFNVSWHKTLEVSTSKDDIAYGITETSGGTFVLTGRTLGFDNNADIWAASFDRDNIHWIRTFGSTASDVAFDIVTSQNNGVDDGFVITGSFNGEAVATKLSLGGSTEWQKTFRPGNSGARGRSIVSTTNGYLIVGDNGNDMLIWKIGKDGTHLNSSTLGGAKNENAHQVISTDDGKFLSAGSTNSNNGIVSGNHGFSDMWMVKFTF